MANEPKHTLNDKVIFYGFCLIFICCVYVMLTQHPTGWTLGTMIFGILLSLAIFYMFAKRIQ